MIHPVVHPHDGGCNMPADLPPIADIIPHPDVIRTYLDRAETEADLLRRQLRLALRRQEEARRLGREASTGAE
jgi:hypothetical protein